MPKSPESKSNKEITPRIVVIGVGNLLQKDEGIGIHAIQALEKIELPPDVKLVDGGTSPDLIAYTRADDKMIIIDCAKAGGAPGDIYHFKPDDLAAGKGSLTSAHEMGVVENLNLMSLTGNKPKDVVIIGIEPAEIDWGMELSAALQQRLPDLIKAVLKEINPR
ncbi:MAG: HyaD/HybD family hydrogenase maturation endopeptidase [Dehalococcoidales bacterium]